jgi:hypothetical protein
MGNHGTMVQSPTPYLAATQRAAALYVPGHPTDAWRRACREAQEAWEAQKGGGSGKAAVGAPEGRRVGVAKGTKR